ncbi:hypothetical protein [Geopseudomonas aromaticivorans]
MKKHAAVLIAVIAASSGAHARSLVGDIVGAGVGAVTDQAMNSSSTNTLEDELARGQAALSSKLPMMLDNDIRLDRVTTGPGRQVTYHHTFVALPSTEFDPVYWKQENGPVLRRKVCGNSDMAPLFDYGVTTSYTYVGSDGRRVGTVDVTPQDCGR